MSWYLPEYMCVCTCNLLIVLICESLHPLRLELFAKGRRADCYAGDCRQGDGEYSSCHFFSSREIAQMCGVAGGRQWMTKPIQQKVGPFHFHCHGRASRRVEPRPRSLPLEPRCPTPNDMQTRTNVQMAPERICAGFG